MRRCFFFELLSIFCCLEGTGIVGMRNKLACRVRLLGIFCVVSSFARVRTGADAGCTVVLPLDLRLLLTSLAAFGCWREDPNSISACADRPSSVLCQSSFPVDTVGLTTIISVEATTLVFNFLQNINSKP